MKLAVIAAAVALAACGKKKQCPLKRLRRLPLLLPPLPRLR
ncbi:MAG: hypothetical protein R3E56_08895 [Burkholderiaceae bacterium]